MWIDYCSLITRELTLPTNIIVFNVLEAIFSIRFSQINDMTCYDGCIIKVMSLVDKGEGDVTTMTSRQVNHYEKNCVSSNTLVCFWPTSCGIHGCRLLLNYLNLWYSLLCVIVYFSSFHCSYYLFWDLSQAMIAPQSMVTFELLLFITLKVEVALNDYLFFFFLQ